MLGNAGDQRGNGKPDGERVDRLTFDFRRRRLRLWARIFAFLIVPFSAILLIIGLHVSVLYMIIVVVVQYAVWSKVNKQAVTYVADNAPSPGLPGRAPGLPRWRHWWAVAAALTVGVLALFWWFDRDLEDRWRAAEAWKVTAVALRAEDEQQRAVVDKPLPTVDTDAEIVSLRSTLDQARKDFPRIRDEVVCEADGTCGSGKEGKRANYEEKVQRRDKLKADIEVNLPRAIDSRTALVQADIDAAKQAKKAAQSRREEISRVLDNGPTWSSRWDALNQVATSQVKTALAVALTAGLVHFGLDVLPLQMTARRICSRRPGADPAAPDAANGGHAEDSDVPPADDPAPAAAWPDGTAYRWEPGLGYVHTQPNSSIQPPRRWWRPRWWRVKH